MEKLIKCPACGNDNCLPVTPSFGKGGIEMKIDKCLKCGRNWTQKEYIKAINSISYKMHSSNDDSQDRATDTRRLNI